MVILALCVECCERNGAKNRWNFLSFLEGGGPIKL